MISRLALLTRAIAYTEAARTLHTMRIIIRLRGKGKGTRRWAELPRILEEVHSANTNIYKYQNAAQHTVCGPLHVNLVCCTLQSQIISCKTKQNCKRIPLVKSFSQTAMLQ